MAALLLGTLIALTIVGSSAVAVAIPVVRDDLGMSVSDAAWVFSVFSLSFAVATATFGRVADLVGLRQPLIVGIWLMAVGSVVVGTAPSFPVLLAGRVVQGAGAGAVPVLANAIVAARWSGPERSRVFGALLAVVAIVSGSGPAIGGLVEALLGWRWVFSLPAMGVLLIAPIARLAPDERRAGSFDVTGAVATSAVVAGLLALAQAPTAGVGVAVAGAGLLALGVPLAVRCTRARPDGFLPHRVIGAPELMRPAFAALALLATYFAMLLAAPELLSAARGLSALQIGAALLPAAITGAIASRLAGRLGPRLGRFRVASAAAWLTVAGVGVAALAPTRLVPIVIGMAGAAVGFAASQAVLVDHVTIAAPAEVRGAALGVFNLLTFVGASIGPAIVGGLSGVIGLPAALGTVIAGPLSALVLMRQGHRARSTIVGP